MQFRESAALFALKAKILQMKKPGKGRGSDKNISKKGVFFAFEIFICETTHTHIISLQYFSISSPLCPASDRQKKQTWKIFSIFVGIVTCIKCFCFETERFIFQLEHTPSLPLSLLNWPISCTFFPNSAHCGNLASSEVWTLWLKSSLSQYRW